MAIILYELVGKDESRPFSPHCWKARMALRHKELAYRMEPVRFTEIGEIEQGVSETVPILRDGDKIISDSFRIADYLEETYPDRPSLFGSAVGRSYARFIEDWAKRDLHPIITQIAILEMVDFLDLPDKEYFRRSRELRFGQSLEAMASEQEVAKRQLDQSLEPIRAVLSETPYLCGDSARFADYVLFGALQWLRVVSTVQIFSSTDPISTWRERCLDLSEGDARNVPARRD